MRRDITSWWKQKSQCGFKVAKVEFAPDSDNPEFPIVVTYGEDTEKLPFGETVVRAMANGVIEDQEGLVPADDEA